MHVSSVSEPHAYLPVGIIHRRPTITPVRPVGSQRVATDHAAASQDEVPGPKLLVDLSLIAPRPTESKGLKAASPNSGTGRAERCETCARRKYQDKSDDPSVSFQTPTHLSPAQAEVMVRMHEQEHVRHETMKARREGKEVETRVSIHYSVCPECGRLYVSGGTTRVVTRESADPTAPQPNGPGRQPGPVDSPSLDLVA